MRTLLAHLLPSRTRSARRSLKAPLSLGRLEDRITPVANLFVTSPAVGAVGSVVREFGSSDTPVRTLLVPNTSDGPARDLAVAGGTVHVFNGTASPRLSTYDVSTNAWTDASAEGWDAGVDGRAGGVAQGGGFVYAADSADADGVGGVLRFDPATGTSSRFAEGTGPIDVAVGGNGLVYTLDASRVVRAYHPDTLGLVRQVVLPESIALPSGGDPVAQDYRALAVDGSGQIFTADYNRVVARFNMWGQVQAAAVVGTSPNSPLGNLIDLDLDGGQLALGSTNGRVGLMHVSFANFYARPVGTGAVYVAFAEPLVAVHIDRVTVNEGDGFARFTISLTRSSALPVPVTYRHLGGSALTGSDIGYAEGAFTFTAGQTAKTFDVPVFDDAADEDTEYFYISLYDVVNATYGTYTGVGTLLDNDPAPTVSVAAASVAEGAPGPTANRLAFQVSLSSATYLPVSVAFETIAGTADAADFTAANGTVDFAPGEVTKTVYVTVKGDNTHEPNETLTLRLSNSSYGTLGVADGVGTIVNDDPVPTVSVTSTGGTEPGTSPTFLLLLSNLSSVPLTVFVVTTDGAALGGTDFVAPAGQQVTFAPGERSKTISVAVLDDDIDEQTESFGLQVQGATGALLASATGTIHDDDPPPTVSVAGASVAEGDSGTVESAFTVSLSNPSSVPVSVLYATSGGSAASGVDFAAASGEVVFAAGQTAAVVRVAVTPETYLEGDETFTLTLSSPVGVVLGTAQATGTILNDDYAPAADAGADATAAEGSAIAFSAAGSSDADGDALTFTWDFGDGTFGTGIAPAHAYADDGVYTVTLTADDGRGGVTTDTVVVTVANVAPTATVAGPASGVRGRPLTFTFAAADPSPADAAALFAYRIAWGDGSTQTVTGPASGVSVAHAFAAAGTFVVAVTATDDDGGTGPAAGRSVAVAAAALQGGDLVVGGTAGGERITLTPADASGGVRVQINGVTVGTFTPTGQIVVDAYAGNDTVEFLTARIGRNTLSVARPFLAFGGDGNDTLDAREADGPGVLLGGGGADLIYGSKGRNVLVGGAGGDTLRGGSGEDLLVGGTTAHDDDLFALAAIRAEWSRTDADSASRRSHLLGQSAGLNGGYHLNATTVANDAAIDELFGGNGQDWLFASTGDRLNDRKNNETVTNV